MRIISGVLFAFCILVAVPAVADTIYDNGPINGTTDGWTINFGFVVSDTFTLFADSTVQGVAFGAWLFPGDVLQTAEVVISSAEFGGTIYTDQTISFTKSGCSSNQYGYNVCTETGTLANTNLSAGTDWLNLENAVVNTGDPVYWDENSGPSQASENSVGTIPSEAFTILGGGCCTAPPSTPEPSSFILLGSAILALSGVLGRKLF